LDEEKERFEETFDDGIGEDIDSAALNEWLFKMKASKIRVNGEEQMFDRITRSSKSSI